MLGGLDATRDGAAFDLGGRRRRAVLAAVVIARGQAVTAGHLAGCVWGEDAPAHSPPGALQSYVSHLRRRLQPDVGARSRHGVIASTGAGYALRLGPDAVDAWRFEHAVASTSGLPPARSVQDVGRSGRWRTAR